MGVETADEHTDVKEGHCADPDVEIKHWGDPGVNTVGLPGRSPCVGEVGGERSSLLEGDGGCPGSIGRLNTLLEMSSSTIQTR
jgi:hypothetical protein